MQNWRERTINYFYTLVVLVLTAVLLIIGFDSLKYGQIRNSLTIYMNNLRDMIFMSTYDSLKKGNMKLFKSHLEEVGTFEDVYEFSLIDKSGIVQYSSVPALVKTADQTVLGLKQSKNVLVDGKLTSFFPVETVSYCTRCHPDWTVGSINSYYKLTLSHEALDAAKLSTMYFHGFTAGGGVIFLAFMFMLFSRYERRKVEEQMDMSASVFEHAIEAMVITSADGIVEKVNTGFIQMTGFTEAEVVGQGIHVFSADDVPREIYEDMRSSIRKKGLWIGELWSKRKNGEKFPVRLSITAVRDSKNRVAHYVSIFYDISIRKAAEQALQRMDQVKGEFISTAAHELRTPLSAIMGYTELLLDAKRHAFSDEQVKDFLGQVYSRSEALNQIVDDLLDVGRIESGKPIDLKLKKTSLFELLKTTIDDYEVLSKGHVFSLTLPESADCSEFMIDHHRIKQVLENLVNNAVKYSQKGSKVCLSCQFKNNFWEISVKDEGKGMTKEQVEKVFDKFYRADASDTAVGGFGLGMSVAKQIVEIHGGQINIQSTLGQGTTATFTLPYLVD